MRRRVCLALGTVALVVSWAACSHDMSVVPRPGAKDASGEDGPRGDRGPDLVQDARREEAADKTPALDLKQPDSKPWPDQAIPDKQVVPDQAPPDKPVILDQTPPDKQVVPDQAPPADSKSVDSTPWPDLAQPDSVPTGCDDKVKNGSETDVDCGGSVCRKCKDTKKCKIFTDCLSGDCSNYICKAGCVHQPVSQDCTTQKFGADWCRISSGCFQMGSPWYEKCRSSTTETQHPVTLSRSIEIQRTEVTQGQFDTLMHYKPSFFSKCGTSCPVEKVNWWEAAAFCNVLSKQAGKTQCYSCTGVGNQVKCTTVTAYTGSKIYACPGYRLPTEAEWEYAYRAGSTTGFYSGTVSGLPDCTYAEANATSIGWYGANAKKTTHLVKQKQANAWGLYDMAGNVYEWCEDGDKKDLGSGATMDPYTPVTAARACRGGSFHAAASHLRAANRIFHAAKDRRDYLGFRCVRSLE